MQLIYFHEFCDGNDNCIDGIDNYQCENLSVVTVFRCPREKTSVASEQYGDGIPHCPHSCDDELIFFFNHDCED